VCVCVCVWEQENQYITNVHIISAMTKDGFCLCIPWTKTFDQPYILIMKVASLLTAIRKVVPMLIPRLLASHNLSMISVSKCNFQKITQSKPPPRSNLLCAFPIDNVL
jgi:hypothetical protein